MACNEQVERLHAYLDGELDAVGAAEFERHLQSCAECRASLGAERALQSALAKAVLYEPAPATLRRSLQSQFAKPSRAAGTTAAYWKWLAIAAMVLLALSSGMLALNFLRSRQATPEFAVAAVDAHLRSLQQGHLEDVQSTDQHTVKPWFDGRVDFAPKVADFSAEGFPLSGGRLDVLNGKTVGALVYARRKHIINVFVAPKESSAPINGAGERQGYHWLAWQSGAFDYIAVTDASAADLDVLRSLIDKE